MRILRAILAFVFFTTYAINGLCLSPFLFTIAFSPALVRSIIRLFYRIFVFFARVTGLFKVEMTDETRHRLATAKGKIIVSNHISLIDVAILLAFLGDSSAIAKKETARNPVLSTVVRLMFIVNSGDTQKLLAKAKRLLAKDVNLLIFPQGTREGKVFHRGAAFLALSSHRPVLPIHLDYSPKVLGKSQPWWQMGERTIVVTIQARDEIASIDPATHGNAKRLTAKIQQSICAQ